MADVTTKEAILKITVDNNAALDAIGKYQDEIEACDKAIKDLKDTQKANDKALKDGAITQEQYNAKTAETKKALNAETAARKELSRQMQEVQYQLKKNIQQQTENEDSLKSLRGQLSQLTSQYDALSKADRESEVGLKMLAQIKAVNGELSVAEENTGRFQRNVGNYGMKGREAFMAMAGGAGAATKAIGTAKIGITALKTASGWIGLVVGIIARIIAKLTENEAAMKSVRQAMAPINALMTGLNKIIEKVTNALGKLAQKFMDWAKKIGLVNKSIGEQNELTKAEIALEEKRRQTMVQNAERERDIAELKARAAEKDKYTYKQRMAMWEEVAEKERAVAQATKDLAAEEYRIALERSKMSANSKEDNDKLAELKAASINADTEYNKKMREINTQLAEIRKAESNAAKQQAQVDKQAYETAAETVKSMADVYEKEIAARLSLVEEGSQEELRLKQEQLDAAHAKEMADLAQYDNTEELRLLKTEKYNADRLQLEQDYNEQLDALLNEEMEKWLAASVAELEQEQANDAARVEMKRATAAAIADAIGEIGTTMEAFAKEDSVLAKASKVLALAKIAINTGVATAAGIAQAQSVPFPANIAAIAATVGTIASGMASAVSTVKSAKFARGGYVSGAGTGTSDSIPARLSNGESVINARATSMFAPVLSALNQMGGGAAIEAPSGTDTRALEQAIARGMQGANLTVSVTEINTVQERVAGIKNVSDI